MNPASETDGDGLGVSHGTIRTYRSGCRCGLCRKANAESMADYRRRKRGREPQNLGPARPPAKHGTRSMYKKCTAGEDGGKCQPCKDANTAYMSMWYKTGGYGDDTYGGLLP